MCSEQKGISNPRIGVQQVAWAQTASETVAVLEEQLDEVEAALDKALDRLKQYENGEYILTHLSHPIRLPTLQESLEDQGGCLQARATPVNGVAE